MIKDMIKEAMIKEAIQTLLITKTTVGMMIIADMAIRIIAILTMAMT